MEKCAEVNNETKIGIISNEREIGVDILKSLACFLVVVLHTVYNTASIVTEVFYYLGVIAIPIFFTVNGYLMLKKNLTAKYILTKIVRLLVFTMFWVIVYSVLQLIISKDITKFFSMLYKWTIQGGGTLLSFGSPQL